MLTRTMKIQVTLFALVATVIVGYTAIKYAGYSYLLGSRGCRVGVDLADSGGIFTGAEVDYRGVAIGKVGELTPTSTGVRVALDLDSCAQPQIPRQARAAVTDLSVIGEQYVDLRADADAGPYLQAGDVIPQSHTSLPVPTQVLLANLDALAKSVDPGKLSTVITELGVAFDGQAANMRGLLDAGATILSQAEANLPATLDLIKAGDRVLATQLDVIPAFASWAGSLRLLSGELRADDPTVRALINDAPPAIDPVTAFAHDVQGPLGTLFGNLITGGDLLAAHVGGLEQLLLLYPRLVADASNVVNPDGRLRLGVVVDWGESQPCVSGYGATARQLPSTTTSGAPNLTARCATGPIRGADRAPAGAGLATAAHGAAPIRVDASAAQSAGLLGDRSWLTLITEPLAISGGGS